MIKIVSSLLCLLIATSFSFAQETDNELHDKISRLEKEISTLKKQTHGQNSKDTETVTKPGTTLESIKEKSSKRAVLKKRDLYQDDSVKPLGSTKLYDDFKDQEEPVDRPHVPPVHDDEDSVGATLISEKKKALKEPTETSAKDFSNAEELYAQGQLYMRQRQLDKALSVLTQFTEKYSDSPQFMLANYWLGEVHLEKKNFSEASIAYGTAYTAYKKIEGDGGQPTAAQKNKAAECLSKLGYCLKLIKKVSDGCTTLRQIDKEFKSIPRNLQIYVAGLKKELKCKS